MLDMMVTLVIVNGFVCVGIGSGAGADGGDALVTFTKHRVWSLADESDDD